MNFDEQDETYQTDMNSLENTRFSSEDTTDWNKTVTKVQAFCHDLQMYINKYIIGATLLFSKTDNGIFLKVTWNNSPTTTTSAEYFTSFNWIIKNAKQKLPLICFKQIYADVQKSFLTNNVKVVQTPKLTIEDIATKLNLGKLTMDDFKPKDVVTEEQKPSTIKKGRGRPRKV